MNYDCIIWDFNGTILNDVMAGISSANELLQRRNLPLIHSLEDYHKVFGFPIKDYYQRLGLDFQKESYEDLAKEWIAWYMKFVENATLQDGVIEALDYFADNGSMQTILSATETNMLQQQVKGLGIHHYFHELLGLDNIHAHSKVSIGRDWIKKNRDVQGHSKVLFIGDTVHDYEVASEMGVECVLIARGHQNRTTLEACGVPVYDQVTDFLMV